MPSLGYLQAGITHSNSNTTGVLTDVEHRAEHSGRIIVIGGTVPSVHFELKLALLDREPHPSAHRIEHIVMDGAHLLLQWRQKGHIVAIHFECTRTDVQMFGIVFPRAKFPVNKNTRMKHTGRYTLGSHRSAIKLLIYEITVAVTHSH